MKAFEYTVRDSLGIHARPAGKLAKLVKELDSSVTVSKDGRSASADRLMAVMGLGIKYGDRITVSAEGGDEEAALEKLLAFFREEL